MVIGKLSLSGLLPALPFIFAVMVGLVFGRVIAPKMPAQRVQQSFAILMLIVAAALGIREFSMLG